MNGRWIAVACAAAVVGATAMTAEAAGKQKGGDAAAVKRGKDLVSVGGCNDCHTPWKMGANGTPEPDLTRLLSGHPEQMELPPAPPPQGPWLMRVTATMTAWAGPWGTSFSANLSPDPETGLGKWTAQNFIEALRSGKHMGRGRPILPPMPWPNYAKMSDADLKAMFAYLQSIPAVKNRVPDPMPPEAASAQGDRAPPPAGEAAPPSAGSTPPAGDTTPTPTPTR